MNTAVHGYFHFLNCIQTIRNMMMSFIKRHYQIADPRIINDHSSFYFIYQIQFLYLHIFHSNLCLCFKPFFRFMLFCLSNTNSLLRPEISEAHVHLNQSRTITMSEPILQLVFRYPFYHIFETLHSI